MAPSKENPQGKSQIEGLVDLLLDLQVLHSRQEPSEESTLSKGDAPSQGNLPDRQADEVPGVGNQGLEVSSVSSPSPTPQTQTHEKIRHSEQSLGEALGSQSVEEEHDSQMINASSILETEPNLLNHSQSNKAQPQETARQSISPQDLATNDLLNTVKSLQDGLAQPHPPEKQQASTNQLIGSKENLNQPENSEAPSKQVLDRLIKSHLQKAQRKEPTSQLITSTNDKDVENSIELFERWQRLLLTQEVMESRQSFDDLKQKLEGLEHQIYEPKELINLLLPLISEILSLKVAQAREEVGQAIAPVIDDMIQRRAQQDIVALSSALAPVLPEAVTQQVTNSPGDFAKALGPEMGTAIKEQISLERDAMVDALYPVIGSTVSKYFAEVIHSINTQVEATLSLEGISRKIRAKLRGISEAELILKEAMPFTVQAIFLIHKGSGLIISEVQPFDSQYLESEMIAGMLTAIRSFVNDVIAQSGSVSEIDQIEYGNSKIILEVAGYCYLAAVTQGQPSRAFIQKMREIVSSIVQRHSKAIELFDGDPTNVPEQVNQLLHTLTAFTSSSTKAKKPQPPVALMLVGLSVLTAIVIPVGIYKHFTAIDHRYEEKTNLALASDPELAVYRLSVDATLGTLKLSGKLPNQYLRAKAEQIAKKVEPKLKVQNAIIPIELPPDPVLAAAEVKRVTNVLNQMEGTVIWADYTEGKVTVQGAVLQEADAQKITQSFQQIPGVKSVTNTVQLQPLAIASRIYFDQGASEIKSEERSKIVQIKAFLDQYSNKHVRLLGHTDPKGTVTENEPLALERATKVRDALVAQGVDSKRLQVAGTIDPPIGVKGEQVPLLSRCVEFQIITP
ncbi:MAG TPA: OmpA family protein [Coleofasciculaceae cyanobacterium]|jgi:outer membrane protein OmpA-like peptidoglycan-associated protein